MSKTYVVPSPVSISFISQHHQLDSPCIDNHLQQQAAEADEKLKKNVKARKSLRQDI